MDRKTTTSLEAGGETLIELVSQSLHQTEKIVSAEGYSDEDYANSYFYTMFVSLSGPWGKNLPYETEITEWNLEAEPNGLVLLTAWLAGNTNRKTNAFWFKFRCVQYLINPTQVISEYYSGSNTRSLWSMNLSSTYCSEETESKLSLITIYDKGRINMTAVYELLKTAVEQDASDIHITVGIPPIIKIGAGFKRLGDKPLTPDAAARLVRDLFPKETLYQEFQSEGDKDFSFFSARA